MVTPVTRGTGVTCKKETNVLTNFSSFYSPFYLPPISWNPTNCYFPTASGRSLREGREQCAVVYRAQSTGTDFSIGLMFFLFVYMDTNVVYDNSPSSYTPKTSMFYINSSFSLSTEQSFVED